MLCAGGELGKDSCKVEQSVEQYLYITIPHTRVTVVVLSQSQLVASILSLVVSALERAVER